jgi:hypothetical protein
MLVVAHSPTPSIVTTAASSNGDGKNALAAWLSWCSGKTNGRFGFSRARAQDVRAHVQLVAEPHRHRLA